MNGAQFSTAEAARTRLRSTLERLGRALRGLRQEGVEGETRSLDGAQRAYDELVDQLALGAEPELRQCPVCGNVGMLQATRCGFCWTKLTPPGEHHEDDEAHARSAHVLTNLQSARATHR